MNETENRDRDRSLYSSVGEEDVDEGKRRLRIALLSLPKVPCPAGFEYRLNRRLQGRSESSRSTGRSWVAGWLGVGLGFGCAVAVALFMFGSSVTNQSATPVADKGIQVVPGRTTEPPTEQVTQTDMAGQPEASPSESQMTKSDSVPVKADPTHISPDRLQQASGEENAPANR